jgi:class 3 adenylate cyclase
MQTKARSLVREESRKLIEVTGRNAVASLEVRLREISSLARTSAQASLQLPRQDRIFRQVLPVLIDFNGDQGVAGGGFWSEPGVFDSGARKKSFFWARDSSGKLEFIDDYNLSESPAYQLEEWYFPARRIGRNSVYWSKSYIDPHSRQPMVTCTAPLLRNGVLEGVFTIDLKLEGIEDFVESVRAKTGGYVILLDRGNRFITFPRGFKSKRELAMLSTGPSQAARDFKSIQEFALLEPRFAPVAAAAEQMNEHVLRLAGKSLPAKGRSTLARDPGARAMATKELALIDAAVLDPLGKNQTATDWLFGQPVRIDDDLFLESSSLLYRFYVPGAYWKLLIVKPISEITAVADSIVGLLLIYLSATVVLAIILFSWLLNRGVLIRIGQTTANVMRARELVSERRFSELDNSLSRVGGEDEIAELSNTMRSFTLELKQTYEALERQSRSFERFVPKQFLQLLGRVNVDEIRLGDQVLVSMAILFADIRGFTTLSEKMTPAENFEFITMLLKRLGPVVRDSSGFIDKYIGDGIMALFPGGALDAIHAGIAIQESIRADNQDRITRGTQPIAMGIGVHAGALMLGVIGEEERLEGTVISDAVNLASRLEGLTSVYGCPLLVSDAALKLCSEQPAFDHRAIAHVQVKGKSERTLVHEVLDAEDASQHRLKSLTRSDFLEALRLHELGMSQDAVEYFDRVLALNPLDKAAAVLREQAIAAAQPYQAGT